MTFAHPIQIRISGQEKAGSKVHRFRVSTLEKLREAAQRRATTARDRMRNELAAAYTSRHSTGRIARSVGYRTELTSNGVSVSFVIADFRELQFITSLAGGYFTSFPVQPYVIQPNPPKKSLRIQFKSGEVIYPLSVTWGSETGGFERDVLAEVGSSEGEAFVGDVMKEFDKAVAELVLE